MRKIVVGVVGVGLLLILSLVVYRTNPAYTQNLVEVPPVQIVLFLPEAEKANDGLLRNLGPAALITSDPAALTAFVSAQPPNAIVIHADLTDKLDSAWLRQQYDAGIIIGGINMLRTDLKQFLGVPIVEGEVLPPFIHEPYMAYVYERGSREEGWYSRRSGIASLEEPNQFSSFVQGVEEAAALNQYHREEAQKEGEANESQP